MRVMLLEDDLQLGKALLLSLERGGFIVRWLRRIAEARAELLAADFDAVVLDMELPDGLGYDVLNWMRQRNDRTPVLFLTVRDAVSERVRALDGGADDYVTKPFSVDELLSRLRALIRRSVGQAAAIWEAGRVRIDIGRREVLLDGILLEVSPREFSVLAELVKHAGHVVPRVRLEGAAFRSPGSIESNALEVHVHNLRRKLGAEMIQTVRGIGYRIVS
ncbi:response regulator [Dyella silvatica]|uniref:response regulator n=1 Tax=Dyella silvatica TaxID=2992128 RepID=UPI00225B1589|nr:response regulator [Dyella silvatica]